MITFIKEGSSEDFIRKNLIGEHTYNEPTDTRCKRCGQPNTRTYRFHWDVDLTAAEQEPAQHAYEILEYCSDCDDTDSEEMNTRPWQEKEECDA